MPRPAAPDLSGRFRAQLLTGRPARSVAAVVERICAVQAQDLVAARLAIRTRSTALRAADVDAALADRSHAVAWLNRGTLHLVAREDYPWLHALTAPTQRTGNRRRLAQEGVAPGDAERAAALIESWLGKDGALTRRELGDRLSEEGITTAGQALVHLLFFASLEGLIVRGPVVGREQAFVLVSDWWGAAPAVDREEALERLARRFLAGHAPATARDLAKWSGLPLGDARRALASIADQTRAVGEQGLLTLRSTHEAVTGVPPPRLLGGFDPVLMGWTDRDWVLGGAAGIITVNGLFRPFAIVDGVAAATWTRAGSAVELAPLRRLGAREKAALEADATDVARFLDD